VGLAMPVGGHDPDHPLTRHAADIWRNGLTSLGGRSCWVGMTMASATQEPLGIAVLLNGCWNKTQPNLVADNARVAMLSEISAAI
jgi:hypothetical protein